MNEQLLLFEEPEYKCIAGTDEAGRGPLAGPVYAACVVLPKDFPIEILDDSKNLSEKKRIEAELIIRQKAVCYSVAWATPEEIDKINILNASMLAMKRAFDNVQSKLNGKIDLLLVDGNKKPSVSIACKAIVKGDSKVPEIMAASILAKNERDRFMIIADKKWPQYNFKQHKGYPTPEHKELLRKYGPCPIHRKSFNY